MHFTANLDLLFPKDTPFPERCARVAAQGFTQVELLFPYDQPLADYLTPLNDYGLKLTQINTPIRAGELGTAALIGAESQFRHDFTQAVYRAQALGANAIHVMAGRVAPGTTWQPTLLNNLQWALEQLQTKPLTLQLEALNRLDNPGYAYHTPLDILPLLVAINHPQLRLQFDFYHTLQEKLSLVETLNQVSTWVSHIQIASPAGRHEPDFDAYPDMLVALHQLKDLGYSGTVGCEYRPATDFESSLHFLEPLRQRGLCLMPLRH